MSLRCCVAVLTFASLLVAQAGRERAMGVAMVGLEVDGKVVQVGRRKWARIHLDHTG